MGAEDGEVQGGADEHCSKDGDVVVAVDDVAETIDGQGQRRGHGDVDESTNLETMK